MHSTVGNELHALAIDGGASSAPLQPQHANESAVVPADLQAAVAALTAGHHDEAIALLEAMADRGQVGAGIAFDRGLAYLQRARSGQGLAGDLGRAAHGFEEALRRNPGDSEALALLEEVRREIGGRDARGSGRAEVVSVPPVWRSIVAALPGDTWMGGALVASFVLAAALAIAPWSRRGFRLLATTIGVCAFALLLLLSAFAYGARELQQVHEAVVVVRRPTLSVSGTERPPELSEGDRVDVLELRATSALVSTPHGLGWIARDAIRMLPTYRP